ncbi:RluA family pseudouridine synthase [Thiomicrorhabdus xiamenensis]|uniref:RluA family pseudouridine synthase n=1 Tax=Thiomicrorhabdus xiamenensis TaxID=2739063 RepID=A0A7D4SZQ0_9GAMM|nr:RluA family pseudouridine synthase [Thiomicrorhabdus xiamenensis]QKI88682.1 RluA family pseudouridine synthase [Thiomicrorhabdus xiamenensis]
MTEAKNAHLSEKPVSENPHFQAVAENETSALELLAQACPFSKAQLKDFAQKGAIWLNHGKKAEAIRRLKRTLKPGQQLDLYYNPKLLQQPLLGDQFQATLIQDFGAYSVWFKPRGMLSQGSKYGDFQSLPRWIELRSEQFFGQIRQCWQIHRLDRATEGLMLIAHNKKTAAALTRLFEEKRIHKTYLANVWGKPSQPEWSSHEPIDGKNATSHFKLIGNSEIDGHHFSRVEIAIETGRKHQIRKHLASANLPIIGDRLYGNAQLDQPYDFDLQLSAYKLRWICPISHSEQTIRLSDELLTLID